MMKLMMKPGDFKSNLEGQPSPIADSKLLLEQWELILSWDIKAWTSAHNPVSNYGADLSRNEMKKTIRESLGRSGEDDPTVARLKWNIKNNK